MTQNNPPGPDAHPSPLTTWRVFRMMLIGAGLVVGILLAWRLAHVLLLAFAAVLVAILLRALSNMIARHTFLGDLWALALSVSAIAALILGFVFLLGTQIRLQFETLIDEIPDLITAAEETLGVFGLQNWLEERLGTLIQEEAMFGSIVGYSGAVLTSIANALLVIFAGIYLAINPSLYRRGIIALFPSEKKDEASDALHATGEALKLWLIGQLSAMVLVGLLTALGLWLIGLPSALALGVIAALLEFVPFAGPILSAVPAITLGLSESPTTAALVLGLYVLIQQIEGNLITPLVHQRAVDLPPALTMFSLLVFGVLFGPLGLLFATPLTVMCYVLIKILWIREVLAEETDIPGESNRPSTGP